MIGATAYLYSSRARGFVAAADCLKSEPGHDSPFWVDIGFDKPAPETRRH